MDENKKEIELDGEKQLSCCGECSAKFEIEARSLQNYSNNNSESTNSSSPLPAWLQQYKNEQKAMGENDQVSSFIISLYKNFKSYIIPLFKNEAHINAKKEKKKKNPLSPSSSH